jgi:MraZ protein
MPLFTGRFDYSVDEKGRLSVPSRHRDQLEREQQEPVLFVTQVKAECLHAYATHEFQLFIDSFSQAADEASRESLRQITSNTVECPLDKQGRLLLPKELLAQAGIKRDVVLVGVAKHIQIWDRLRYEAWVQQQSERISARPGSFKAPADLV